MLEDVGFGPITMPAADIYETPTEFVVELEVPGFEEQELELEVTDHTLTVTGEAQAETKRRTRRRSSFTSGLHARSSAASNCPWTPTPRSVAAKFEGGVLEIHAPKIPGTEPRKIEIEHVA